MELLCRSLEVPVHWPTVLECSACLHRPSGLAMGPVASPLEVEQHCLTLVGWQCARWHVSV